MKIKPDYYIRLSNGTIKTNFQTVKSSMVVKKANTIEELCDEIVYVRNGYNNHTESVVEFKRRNKKLFK